MNEVFWLVTQSLIDQDSGTGEESEQLIAKRVEGFVTTHWERGTAENTGDAGGSGSFAL